MSYTLYLDDVRTPCPSDGWDVVARTGGEFFEAVRERGLPSIVSFDHDLGMGQPDGMEIGRLVDMDLSGEVDIPGDFRFEVHSMNPVGRENIKTLLEQYLAFKKRC